MKILIAEDSPAYRLALQRAVEGLGHECVMAEDGDEAWAIYERGDFEVLISDWVMPGIEGDELCRRVRSSGSAYCYVIVLTALDDNEHMLRGMTAGADDFLAKPLVTEELEARLAAATRVTKLHRALTDHQIELKRLNDELHGVARQDPLTAVGNRLRLEEDLDRIEARAVRDGHDYAVVMCDIDHFKGLNDHSGHERGDVVLREVAQGLVAGSRRTDSVYRYGGEELVVVMPNCSAKQMGAAAERLRAGVERLGLVHPTVESGVVTVSAGVATRLPKDDDGVEGVLRRADAALYRAKHAGRNRVVSDDGTGSLPVASSIHSDARRANGKAER
jgi:two-component system, cell cycle response regulator